jgi:aspartyl-tRNA(Asn)/glutamyl-tRNA(Gln) amidotransferase subunit C
MKISLEEVDRVALLARLRLTAEEKSALTQQLDDILEYMDKLNRLDTAQVVPFAHALDSANAFREDKVTNRPNPEPLLANAPDRDRTFFKVPKIIE